MSKEPGGRYARDRQALLTVYFLFYFGVLASMVIDHRLLSAVRPAMFNFNRDLPELAIIATGLPKWMIAHTWSFGFADTLAFALPLAWMSTRDRQRGRGWVFVLYIRFDLLLADLFLQVHHEPFILYVLLPLAMITRREERFYLLLKACRFYFIYVFVSAAVWKIARGAVWNTDEMSRILLVPHSDLLSGDCPRLTCR